MKRYFAFLMIMALVGACATTADAKRRVHRKAKPKAKTTATVTTTGRAQGHDYVDLGLPSGTLWATMIVGANSPEDHDDSFAWGETQPKSMYDWSTYKWRKGRYNSLTKYCTDSGYGYNGFVDNKTELDPADDAATANWGSGWRMPSLTQIQELYENCTSEWTTINGVDGRLFKSKKNGASLFFPATGCLWNGELDSLGWIGYYWSRTLNGSRPSYAYALYFSSGSVSWSNDWDRFSVRSVRAVRGS